MYARLKHESLMPREWTHLKSMGKCLENFSHYLFVHKNVDSSFLCFTPKVILKFQF